MTASEQALYDEYLKRQSFLEPFRHIVQGWSVETQHKFQRSIRELDLVAEGDLENDWSVKVIASDTGTVVAEFGFNEYGRFWDMRLLKKSHFIPIDKAKEWVRSKVESGRIEFSTLAERLGVGFTDPRVIHDLAYRFARSPRFNGKRRRWYNKGKTAQVDDLYDQLYEATRAIVREDTHRSLSDTRAVVVS